MALVSLVDIRKHYGAREVLAGVSFQVERGDHAALVGSNGAGKSTILRIIAGMEEPDGGSVARARGVRVAYLPQDPEFTPTDTLYDVMLAPFREAIEAQEQLRVLERQMAGGNADGALVDEYGRLQALVEHVGYDYRAQIERVLTGLELPAELWHTPVSTLSGGQRTRANLARTLLEGADVLLLDEPTNHLDIRAVEWLESYLRDLHRAFVIVAHDRYLLDRVTRRTLELSSGRVTAYDAPYSRFLELKAERTERQRQVYEAQQEQIARTEEFIRRYGAGQRYKEARGRQKRLDRLERLEKPPTEEVIHLRAGRARRSGDVVLEATDLVAGYPGKPLVRLPERVTVRRGERVAIVGPNGSGKTTLLRTLVGALAPLQGKVRWGANTSTGYYSQTLGQLDDRLTVLEEVQRTRPLSEGEARTYLARFLFPGDDVFKPVAVLSGGEKSRVALAKLLLEDANVLVLDEPTNHLDIASRDALQPVLSEFGGTLLFVSHDRFLIDSLAQQLWLIGEGKLVRYEGTYTALVEGRAGPLDRDTPPPKRPDGQAETPEARLRRLEGEAGSLAARLSEVGPTVSLGQLAELMDRYDEVQSNLEEAQRVWIRSVRDQVRAYSA
ncbi:MAG: ABC-F family ATP-binding cassette domain-containing protein [Chloroflexi bacterium]|nr:ABC-F family ATP-binding cassette domain-containing protein [Chloroflexota bacterium]